MKFTLITVSFNSSKTIRNTIESVLAQTYYNIEYIIIDGYSTDDTVGIIKEYEPDFRGRIRWLSEPDKGLYDAMNKGIKMAAGDIVGFINSDDMFCDDYAIEKVIKIFLSKKSLDSVYADLYYVSQNDTSRIVRHWISGKERSFKYGWHPAHPTLYIKKRVYDKFGLFNLEFKLAADFEIMLRFLEKHKISTCYLHETLVKMRLGGTTNKNFSNIYFQNIECIRAFKVNNIKINQGLYLFFRILPKLLQFKK